MFRNIFARSAALARMSCPHTVRCSSVRSFFVPPWPPSSNPFKILEKQVQEMEKQFDNLFSYRRSFWGDFIPIKERFGPSTIESFRLQNSIVEEDGVKKFLLEFDVRRFKPEEISIVTSAKNKTLTIEAKHKGEKSRYEFCREMALPEGVEPSEVTCRFTSDGILQVRAPYNEPVQQKPHATDTEVHVKHE